MDLHEILDSRDVPNPPGSALRVIEIKNDPEAGIDDLVEVVDQDPALAAKILATANSPAYRRGDPVTSLERAVRVLGFRSVTTIALALAVTSSVPSDGEVAGVALPEFWERSVLTATASRLIAAEVQKDLGEEAFFVGLVVGMGRVVLGLVAPERYEPLARAHGGWPTLAEERARLELSSATVTGALLRQWGMPELLSRAAELVDAVDPAPPAGVAAEDIARIVALATDVTAFYVEGGGGDRLQALIAEAERVGIEPATSAEILDGLLDQVAELARALAPNIDLTGYAELTARARDELVDLSLQTEMEWHLERNRRRQLEEATARLKVEVRSDPLTGLCNRRGFEELLEQQLHLRLRHPNSVAKNLGVIMLDLDDFKTVNDTYGHDAGDAVLQTVARLLDATTRREETLARIGGEEFVLLVPSGTNDELAMAAERLRATIERIEIELPVGGVVSVTASFGAATLERVELPDDGVRLMKAADEAMYEAKAAGRNRVVVASDRP